MAVFKLLALPLPYLLGPMFACLGAALAGARLGGFKRISALSRTVLGVAVGAAITPALLDRVADFALSAALIPLFVLLIGAVGVPYFRRVCGFDPATAYYAAMPGGLQEMITLGAEAGGSARALSLVHATRVLAIVTLTPALLTLIWNVPLDAPLGAPAASVPPVELAILAACALLGWPAAKAVGLFGAAIFGPLILTAALSLADVIHHRPPAESILVAQFFIGVGVGVHYVGITVAELRRVVLAALGYCGLLALLALIFAQLVAGLGAAPPLEALLAFAPGGQAEMVVLAIVAGADMPYVVTMHLTRLIVVILGAPVAARLARRRAAGGGGPTG